MSKKNKKKLKKNVEKALKGIKGDLRELHFASGGSLREWIGVGGVHKNPADKRETRGVKKKKAIKEGEND